MGEGPPNMEVMGNYRIILVHLFLRSAFLRILHTTILDRWCTNVFYMNIQNDLPFLFYVI